MTATVLDLERVRLALDDGVATLTLNHPEVLNAMSAPMLVGLNAALDAVEDPAHGVRCVLLTGEGRAFCTGANLQGRGGAQGASVPRTRRAGTMLETQYHPVLRRLRDLPCPLVAAVNGPAAGAGMSFALMADLILDGHDAIPDGFRLA